MSKKVKNINAMYFLSTIIVIICLILKITHGIDSDEEMAIANLYRTSLNYKSSIFTLNWDPLQLASCLFFPVIYIFRIVNYHYLVIGIRLIAIFIHFLFIRYLYGFMINDLKINKTLSYIVSCILMLTYPKYIVSLDHSNQIVWFYTIHALEIYRYFISKKDKHLYISGLFLSLAILAHPGIVFSLIASIAIFFYYKDSKSILKILTACTGMFIVFLFVFLINNSGLFENLRFYIYEFVNDGSHKTSLINKIDYRIILSFITLALFAFVTEVLLIKYKKYCKFSKFITSNIYINLLLLYFNIAYFLYSFIIHKQLFVYADRFLVLAVSMLIVSKKELKIISIYNLVLFIILFLLSNQGIKSNSYYLVPLSLIIFARELNTKHSIVGTVNLIMFYASAVFLCGILVRIEKTVPSVIKDNFYLNKGVMAGIYTNYNDFFWNEELYNLIDNKFEGMTIVANDPNTLSYIYFNSNIVAPSVISTPSYDEQWIDYFKINSVNKSVILIENSILSKSDFEKYKFINFLLNEYNKNQIYTGKEFSLFEIYKK